MEFLDKAGVETLWAKVKSIVPTDAVRLGAVNQMTSYKPFEFRTTAESATYGACIHASANHWRVRTGPFSNMEQNIVIDVDCVAGKAKINGVQLNKLDPTASYNWSSSGFSSYAFGETRDLNKAYISVLKPQSTTITPPFNMGQTDGTVIAAGNADTHMIIACDYPSPSTMATAGCRIGAGNNDKLNWCRKVVFYDSNESSITASAFYESSDKNLKENIEEICKDKVANVNNISFKSFNFKEDKDKTTKYGVIAQEVEEVGLNELVSEDEQHSKCVDYTSLLCLKMQAMEEKIRQLEEKIAMLENK